jgi:2-keto-4-pentenoate hydratase/2-oxohepta-3-ene-1,7-dioic acid hydratase in catechol pathway
MHRSVWRLSVYQLQDKPEKFLKGGENIVTTIEVIGTIKNKVINFK